MGRPPDLYVQPSRWITHAVSKVSKAIETIRTAVGVRMDAAIICPRGETMGKGQYSRKRTLATVYVAMAIQSGHQTLEVTCNRARAQPRSLIHYLVVTGKKAVQQQYMAILQDLGTRTARILLKLRNSPQIFVEKLGDHLKRVKFGRRRFLPLMGNHTKTRKEY